MQLNKKQLLVLVVACSAVVKTECAPLNEILSAAGLALKDGVVAFAKHPQGQDVLFGAATGPAARLVGREIYKNVAGADQNVGLLCVAGMIGLGTGARFVGGNSNLPLNLAMGIASAALTLKYFPVAQKTQTAEQILDKDIERNAKKDIAPKVMERVADKALRTL